MRRWDSLRFNVFGASHTTLTTYWRRGAILVEVCQKLREKVRSGFSLRYADRNRTRTGTLLFHPC